MYKTLIPFSGGKDSQACLLWAKNQTEYKNLQAVFCDTGWEHEITYEHVKQVTNNLDIPLVTVKSKKYDGMVDMAIKKGRMPSTKARFCTQELKVIPMIDHILQLQCNVFIIEGIRADESIKRSKMQPMCTFFKYYFEPYKSNEIIINHYNSNIPKNPEQLKEFEKATSRLILGKNDEKYFTYRKKDVLLFRKKYSDDIIRPLFNWTAQQTINYILDNGMQPNNLYYQGFSRVGCFPCIMCTKDEIKKIIDNHPKYLERLINAEGKVKATFFSPNYIPKYAKKNKDKNGKLIATIQDVVSYIKNKNNDEILFEETNSCSSHYKLCD